MDGVAGIAHVDVRDAVDLLAAQDRDKAVPKGRHGAVEDARHALYGVAVDDGVAAEAPNRGVDDGGGLVLPGDVGQGAASQDLCHGLFLLYHQPATMDRQFRRGIPRAAERLLPFPASRRGSGLQGHYTPLFPFGKEGGKSLLPRNPLAVPFGSPARVCRINPKQKKPCPDCISAPAPRTFHTKRVIHNLCTVWG